MLNMSGPAVRKYFLELLKLHKYSSWWAIYEQLHAAGYFKGEYEGSKAKAVKKMKRLYKSLHAKKQRIISTHTIKKTESNSAGISSEKFYASTAWRELRYIALKNSLGACNLCGARASDDVVLHVDHIVPRSKDPSKAMDLGNLQVLCVDCNIGKSNYDSIDWRM